VSEILEANDYFILAVVSAVVFLGLFFSSVHILGGQQTAEQSIYYGVSASLGFTSLFLMIGFIIGGIVKRKIKKR
jgi:membrane protein DedA with SNARE-associated domain